MQMIERLVERNGHTCASIVRHYGGGYVVLAKASETHAHKWATWRADEKGEGLFWGHYAQTWDEAWDDFQERTALKDTRPKAEAIGGLIT